MLNKQIFVTLIIANSIYSAIVPIIRNIYRFNESSGNTEINADANTDLEIDLEGNPTTGYSWYLTNYEDIDTSLLEPVELKKEKEKFKKNKYNQHD